MSRENITDVSIQVAYDLPVPFVMSFMRAEGVFFFVFLGLIIIVKSG